MCGRREGRGEVGTNSRWCINSDKLETPKTRNPYTLYVEIINFLAQMDALIQPNIIQEVIKHRAQTPLLPW